MLWNLMTEPADDPAPLCDDCGGTGETEAGAICPTCEGYGTHPEASITDEPPDDIEVLIDLEVRNELDALLEDDDGDSL